MAGEGLEGYTVLGFDLETTGIDVKRDKIIQYALVGSTSDNEEVLVEELVDPGLPIPKESEAVHGISDSQVRGLPGIEEHFESLRELIEGSVLVGHNIKRFDWPLFENECLRHGFMPPKPIAIVDTYLIARALEIPGRHRLGDLCARYNIELKEAHRASADAAATMVLLWAMMVERPNRFRINLSDLENMGVVKPSSENSLVGPVIDDLEKIDSRGRLRISNDGHIVLSFGKYKGRTVTEILSSDIAYLNWLKSPAGGLDEEGKRALNDVMSSK